MVAEQNPIMAWSLATKLLLRFYVALSPFPMRSSFMRMAPFERIFREVLQGGIILI